MSYLVIQHAVYNHGVAGPFDTLEEAIAFADAEAANDVDAHHGYSVYAAGPHWVRQKSTSWRGPKFPDLPDPVYTTFKGGW